MLAVVAGYYGLELIGVPISATYAFLNEFMLMRWALNILFMGCCGLTMLYFNQTGMLYVPAQPIQYIESNPVNYRSPKDRNMHYEEVWVTTGDGLRLQGWLMLQESNPKDKPTVIFFHENAGNIGLRLDYFSLLY